MSKDLKNITEEIKNLFNAKRSAEARALIDENFPLIENESDIVKGEFYLLAGKVYFRFNLYHKSLEFLFKSRQYYENSQPDINYAETLYFTAVNQTLLGDISRALETCFESLEFQKRTGTENQKSEANDLIGILYNYVGKKELGLEYHLAALKTAEEKDGPIQQGAVYNSIGNFYYHGGNTEEAEKHYRKSLELGLKINDYNIIGTSYNNLGNIEYKNKNNIVKGEEYYRTAIGFAEKAERAYSLAEFTMNLSDLLSKQKKFDEAFKYINHALEIAKNAGVTRSVNEIYKNFVLMYQDTGDYKKALEYLELADKNQDEMNEELSKSRVDYMNIIHRRELILAEKKILEKKNEELKILNDRLSELNRDKIEFLGIAVHDLKNPLSAIMLLASTIKNYFGKSQKQEVQKRLERISTTSDRMQAIIKNLLDINTIENEKFVVDMKQVDLMTILKKVISDNEYLAQKKNIHLALSSNLETANVNADSAVLYQIFENLLSNSIKYSPLEAPVNINVAVNEGKTLVSFEDRGIGIKPEFIDKLFEKFSKVGTKTTGGESSTGLGLSIVKKLTEACNGKVFCESVYGKGSRFVVEMAGN